MSESVELSSNREETEEDHQMEKEDQSLLSGKKASNKGRYSIYFYCTWILAFLLIGFIILLIVFIALFAVARHEANQAAQVCSSPGCVSLSTEILSVLDETKSPCDDFYHFACGGWERVNTIPEGSGSYSLFGALDKRNTIIISKLLDPANTKDNSEAVRKAMILYDLCTNTSSIDARGKEPLVDLISELGGWKLANIPESKAWSFDQLWQAHLKGGPAFFSMAISADAKNSDKQSIYIGQGGLTLSQTAYANPKLTTVLLTYMKRVVTLLGGTDSDTVETKMKRVLDLESNLSTIFYKNEELRDLKLTYNPMTLQNLTTYPPPSPFNWLTFMRNMFKQVGSEGLITEETEVIVETPLYFDNLTDILDKFEMEDFENYVKWTVARQYVGYLDSNFQSALNDFLSVVYGTGKAPRYETCTSIVTNSLQYAISRLYSMSDVISGTRNKMNSMIDNIQAAFKDRLNGKSWLDAQTKDACRNKVDAISRQIAYPDFIYNVSILDGIYAEMNISEMYGYFENIEASHIFHLKDALRQFGRKTDKTRWGIPPTAVNAYYSPSFNQFVFLEGILHPPFFNPEWPDYFLYGAIGVVIGHELSHGFDDQGQKYDAKGNYQPWWTPESQKNFEGLTKCFVTQYGNYSVQGYQVNGELTLGENIADNGGLHTSYQAYQQLTNGMNLNLPAINGKYTHNQMFFIAFGQVWCTLYTPQYLRHLTQTNPHSPGTIRVQGTLSNSKEFADAFSCSSSALYNPSEKCELW